MTFEIFMVFIFHKLEMNKLLIDSKIFLQEYALIDKKDMKNIFSASFLSSFTGVFGVSPHVCSILWGMLKKNKSNNVKHNHLLWTLYFLRHYPTHNQMSSWTGCSRVTTAKVIWPIIGKISELKMVSIIIKFYFHSILRN